MLRRLLPYCHDLWSHRELLRQFSVRTVEIRHKGSHLGLLWSFLNPLLMLGLYVFVFGFIFDGKFGVIANETRADYAIGIFFGLTLFGFIGEVMAVSPTIIIANPNFVKKVVFPLEILPAAHVAAAGFHLLISLGLALISLLIFGRGINPELLWLPVIIFPLILLALGVSWMFAALGVFFRDIGQFMQFLSMSLMYSSAVFFSATLIPASIWMFLKFNPLLLAIELARNTALWAQPMNYHHLGYIYLISIATCHIGYLLFRKMKPAFADVL
jgi:lipopolysaccharide transport system permease protein